MEWKWMDFGMDEMETIGMEESIWNVGCVSF